MATISSLDGLQVYPIVARASPGVILRTLAVPFEAKQIFKATLGLLRPVVFFP